MPVTNMSIDRTDVIPVSRLRMLEIVSHDMKNPLSTIIMAADFMLDALVPDDAAHNAEREQLRLIGRGRTHAATRQ